MRVRFWKLIGIVLVGALGTVLCGIRGVSNRDENLYADRIPIQVGRWKGTSLSVPDWVKETLGTRDTISRVYVKNGKDAVVLNITHSRNSFRTFYPPDYCHMGSGWELESKGRADFNTAYQGPRRVPATKILLRKGSGWRVSLYWFKSRNRATPSYLRQQLDLILDRIKSGSSSGTLIQIFTETTADKLEEAEQDAKEFAGLIFPLIQKEVP
ncbi:MAG: exosortase C-terminal domain/associated protein EpsI [Candidatus Omnitrophota bacterium]